MESQMLKFVRFVKDESGATAIEYGLIAAAMGLALVTAMPILASSITGKFTSLAGHITSGS
jgi:pilus assembly protein Flp/PilA